MSRGKDLVMVRQIIFDNEITLWWEYTFTKEAKSFFCYINEKEYSSVEVTHISYTDLLPNTEYKIFIKGDNGQVVFDDTIKTKPLKNKIDVSLAPFCAVGDGKTLNTIALQKAFDACTKDDYVYIPSGTFLTGALRMHSDFELVLAEGCILQGSSNREDYLPKIRSRFEGLEFDCYSSLLNAGELDSKGGCNCQNVTIRGKGRIVGGGNALRVDIINYENERLKDYILSMGDKIKEFECKDTIAGRFRGRLVNISNVDGFTISGVSIESSPSWNLHMVYSKNLTVYNCTFVSHGINNGDGVDPDSVENCAIFNCRFDTSDDCIAIKSGKNPEGNIVNRKTTNVYIFDCVALDGHSVCVGSEMSGGVENVYIWDCDFNGAFLGVQFKFAKARGGYIKNCYCYRSKISRVCIKNAAYNNDGDAAPTVPRLSNFYFEDTLITGENTRYDFRFFILICGIDEENPVEDVYFNNVRIGKGENLDETIVLKNTKNIVFNNTVFE